ncbi:MAG: sensor histidine kinase [bacterium]|nr:sensor histidine kinase [bacterium]
MTELSFTVDSALLRELGEKLVETVHLALAELIKNAYDADATSVTLRFKTNQEGEEEIHIIDDGIGMNFDEVEAYWMNIATSNKADNTISRKFGRYKTGAKGIGRFCCRRLGTTLTLLTVGTSCKNGTTEIQKTRVEFLWDKFEPGKDVTDIKCPGEQAVVEDTPTGTTLIIGNLTDEGLGLKGYNWLKRELAMLAANRGTESKGFEADPGFNIILDIPDLEGVLIDIRDGLIESGWATLTARINTKHQAIYELDAMGIGKVKRISSKLFPTLKDITLKLGILVYNIDQMRDRSILSKGTLKKILPDWGGVQVRYQGFRVSPYGDDDWLDIDRDRGLRRRIPEANELHVFAKSLKNIDADRVLLNMLSMRSYVGSVDIGRDSEGFEMKANREGFVASDAVKELKEFVRFGIDWSTIYRDYYLRKKAIEEAANAQQQFEEISGETIDSEEQIVESGFNYLEKEIDSILSYLPEKKRKEVKKSFDSTGQAIIKHDNKTREELLHLRLIASTSTLILVFAHEVKSLLGQLENTRNNLSIIEEILQENDRSLIKENREILTDLKARFKELLELTSLVGTVEKGAKVLQLSLSERIARAVDIFKLITNRYDIKINYGEVPRNIVVKSLLESELYAVLLNILSNSIKSVIAAGGGTRKIEITAERIDGKTKLTVKDNGLELSPNHFEAVFVPFQADPGGELYHNLDTMLNKEDKHIVGTGSGLGLSIVRDILTARKNSIYFIEPEGNWKNQLEIELT